MCGWSRALKECWYGWKLPGDIHREGDWVYWLGMVVSVFHKGFLGVGDMGGWDWWVVVVRGSGHV
eukprot:3319661-Karenia_brevis.AAC.1